MINKLNDSLQPVFAGADVSSDNLLRQCPLVITVFGRDWQLGISCWIERGRSGVEEEEEEEGVGLWCWW